MDIYHYKILKPGDICWALLASIDRPHVYLPVQCEINDAEKINASRWSYTLRPISFVDRYEVVIKYFIGTHFRMYNFDKNKLCDIKINIDTNFATTNSELIKAFNLYYCDEYFVAMAPLVFETKEECIKNLKQFEVKLSEQWAKSLQFFATRQRYYRDNNM